jgi:hypothetical protein
MGLEDSPQIWDFKPAHDFSKAFRASPVLPSEAIPTGLLSIPYDPKSSEPKSLGDLNRMFEFLGKPGIHIPTPKHNHKSSESSYSSLSGQSTAPSSAPDDVEHFDDFVGKAKGVRWKDEVAETDLTETRRRNRHLPATDLDAVVIARLVQDDSDIIDSFPPTTRLESSPAVPRDDAYTSGFESESEPCQRRRRSSRPRTHSRKSPTRLDPSAGEFTSSSIQKISKALLPACIIPQPKTTERKFYPPPPNPKIHLDPTIIQPQFSLTAEEKRVKLCKKLRKRFGDEPNSLLSTHTVYAITNWGGNVSDDGIHVFVDCSNIIIGFYNALKIARKMNINARIKQPPISYQSLALICKDAREAFISCSRKFHLF